VKFINRTDAIEQTLQAQHNMHVTLKDYKNANFIPDVIGSCTVPPDTFNSYFKKRGDKDHLEPKVRNEIDLIVTQAKTNACDVNVLVMEFFEGSGCTEHDKKYNSDIIAAILSVLIITGCLSLDTHCDNVMTMYHDKDRIILKLIDWDKFLSLYEPGDLNKDKILGWLDSLNSASKELLSQWLSSYKFASAKGKDPIKILKSNFANYYNYLQQLLPWLLSQWNTNELTYNQKIYYTFELVTFFALMDVLFKNVTYPGSSINCSWLMYSLFERLLPFKYISLDDWLTFRLKFIEFFKEKSTQPDIDITRGQDESVKKTETQEDDLTKVLTGIVEKLNTLLHKSSALGGHSRYLKRTRHKVIKKPHFNKNNRKSIKKLRRSLPYKYKHIRRAYSHYKHHKH
jgi:hypothetical protein